MCKQPLPNLNMSNSSSPEPAVAAGPTEEEKKYAYDAWCNSTNQNLAERQHPV